MSLREPDTISDQIAQLQLDLLELKAKQITSQESGVMLGTLDAGVHTITMDLSSSSPLLGSGTNIAFLPDLLEHAVAYPFFEIEFDGYTYEESTSFGDTLLYADRFIYTYKLISNNDPSKTFTIQYIPITSAYRRTDGVLEWLGKFEWEAQGNVAITAKIHNYIRTNSDGEVR